jgi:hypothetical protein
MTHTTHYCCNNRLREEGGKARCCDCHPHDNCGDDQAKPAQDSFIKKSDIKTKIYPIVDSFLAEAKDQDSNYRSLDRLNQDRHLAVEALEELFNTEKEEALREQIENIMKLITECK